MPTPTVYRRRVYKALALFASIAGLATCGLAYTHPGIPLTSADLATLKANLNLEPWKSGYAALQADSRSSLSYTMQGPFASVSRNPNVNLTAWRNDMIAVYNLARMGYFTGNTSYSQKARDILISWANTHTSFGGSESGLDLGDYAFRFAGGASILRGTWAGWTTTDTTTVKNYFSTVLWPATSAGLNGTTGPANKGSLYLAGGIAVAAFCDDTAKFEAVLERSRINGGSGMRNTLATGEMGETGRDQGHAYGDLLANAFLAEVAYKQGYDIYGELENRLLACGEYYARNNLVSGVQFVPFGTIDYLYNTPPADAGGGYAADSMGLYILRGAYNIRKGLPTPWMEQKIARQPVNMDNWMMCKSEDAATASAASGPSLPSTTLTGTGFTSTDIGGATPAGSATFSGGTWTITGGGIEVWTHGSDSCTFAYKAITGDCAIIAKVSGVQNTHTNAKAGVMIRESLAANTARRAWIGLLPSTKIESYLHGWSECWGGTNWEKQSRAIPSAPWWVKIERRGNIISTFSSQDGTSWAANNIAVFDGMSSTAYIGLFVSSLVNGTPNTSTFQVVSVTGGTGGVVTTPAAPAALFASPDNKRATLRWLPSAGATGYDILRSTTSGGGYTSLVSNLSASTTSYTDAGLTNGTTYYYVVRAKNSAGTSGNSAQEQATPQSGATCHLAFGGVANASHNSGSSTSGAAKAFDRNPGSKWFNGDNGTSGWISYDFGAGNEQVIKTYTLTAGNDVPGRDPKTWTLLGSQDGAAWTNIDSQTDQTFAQRGQVNTYPTSNTTAYRYYRLDIAANNGNATGIQIGEFGLWSDSGRTLPDGRYRIVNRKSNKAMNVNGGGTSDGSTIVQWGYSGANNEKWDLVYQGNGQYRIDGVASGKSLDVTSGSTANGAILDIFTWSGANRHRWTVQPTADGYWKITNVNSGKVADVSGASTADGANIIQWPYGDGDNQQWSITVAP